jgi:hypothetical protein
MKMTERDRHVLVQSARFLLWFGVLGWALSYSFWLGAAFSLYVALYGKLGLYSPESLKTFRRNI